MKMESVNKTAKVPRNFQESWLQDAEFKDVNASTKAVTTQCSVCTERKQKNSFRSTSASNGFQQSALVHHIAAMPMIIVVHWIFSRHLKL